MKDNYEVIFNSSYGNKSLTAEDQAFMNLSREVLICNIDDYKSRMSAYNKGARSDYKTVILLLPNLIFFRSSICSTMLELLGCGGYRDDYNLLGKLDRLYNKKGLKYDLTSCFSTKLGMQKNLRRVLKVMDMPLREFVDAYCNGICYTQLSKVLFDTKKKSLELVKSRRPESMSDTTYEYLKIALKKMFEENGIGDMLNFEGA